MHCQIGFSWYAKHECIQPILSGSMAIDSFLAVQQPKNFYGMALAGSVCYSFIVEAFINIHSRHDRISFEI